MSSLNWERSYRYVGYLSEPPVRYELWGLYYPMRLWFHEPLACVEKFNSRTWELTVRSNNGKYTKHFYKTLKEAQAMGIAIVAMEGIKHDV